MHEKVVVTLSACALALAACKTNEERCKEAVDQLCERTHECATNKDAAWEARFGTNVENCKALLYANPLQAADPPRQGIACDKVDTIQKLCSNFGQLYATIFYDSKAEECRQARAAMSCADYLGQSTDPNLVPQACNERCTQ
jgi:hypothetical protein